jgi:hypothetical protein
MTMDADTDLVSYHHVLLVLFLQKLGSNGQCAARPPRRMAGAGVICIVQI